MDDFIETLDKLKNYTGMYVSPELYSSMASLILGYDLACKGQAMTGFQDWLVNKYNAPDNLHWSVLIPYIMFPSEANPNQKLKQKFENEQKAINMLIDLIMEYYREKNTAAN